MKSSLSQIGVIGGLLTSIFAPLHVAAADKPAVPLTSSSRWIMGADGQRVKMRCVNWAGHLEANVPEGLHKQPVEKIADYIAGQGFNCVRLTYSIDMARNQGLKVEDSFRAAASAAGVEEGAMMDLYHKAVDKNAFLDGASVIDVFDRVQSALWERGVMTVLDNHVSKASWCCNLDDGNGWWSDAKFYLKANSRYFDTEQWLDGLTAMAKWSNGRPGIVAMSLRNELRAHVTQIPFASGEWRNHMPRAARVVHNANPDVLVILGGLNGGTDLSTLRMNALDTSDWAGKNVWEAHSYSFTVTTPSFGSCDIRKTEYGGFFGFLLEQNKPFTGPLFLTEFGFGMTGGPNDGLTKDDYDYLTCLVSYMESNDADWALWAVQGSYYVRDKEIDKDEGFGLLDRDWNDTRNPKYKELLGKMFEVTQGP